MTDQIKAWKAAIADLHKRQRGRRGKRKTGIARVDGPGMIRRSPPSVDGQPERIDGGAALTVQPSPGNGAASRPGPSQKPQADHPHHAATPSAP